MANELKDLLIEAEIFAAPYAVINDDAVYEKMAEYLVAKGVKVGDADTEVVAKNAIATEKQIDEIAKLICTYPQCVNYNIIGGCKAAECQTVDIAENLYNQGYRKVEQGEWISVEDMLPNKDELVLCVGAKGGMFLGEIRNFNSFDKSAYTYVPNSRGGRYSKYWLPLPTPPKMKGE